MAEEDVVPDVLVDIRNGCVISMALVLHDPIWHGMLWVIEEPRSILKFNIKLSRPCDQGRISGQCFVRRNRNRGRIV